MCKETFFGFFIMEIIFFEYANKLYSFWKKVSIIVNNELHREEKEEDLLRVWTTL